MYNEHNEIRDSPKPYIFKNNKGSLKANVDK